MNEVGKSLTGKDLGKGISQRKDKRYEGRYIDVNGVRRSIYDANLSRLRQSLAEARYKTQQHIDTHNEKVTVETWYNRWYDTYKVGKVRETTLVNIQGMHNAIIKPYIARKQISKIAQWDIQNIINEEHKRGVCNSTLKMRIAYLSSMMKIACENDYIHKNPCYNLEYPAGDTYIYNCKERRALTPEEERNLLAILPDKPWANLLRLLLFTGLRVGEACALTWKDVDMTKGELTVSKTVLKGKLSPPKTQSGNRTIPLCSEAKALLSKLQHENFASPSANIFVNKNKNMYDANGIGKILRYYLDVNGMESLNVTAHILRHTFATRCFEAGIEPKVIQSYLGHSNLQTTLNIYTHVDIEMMSRSIEKLSFGV